MRRITITLAAAAIALSAGCSADQANQLTMAYKNARTGGRSANATAMAGSAMAAQSALYHIASALSGQVSKEFGGAKAFRIAEATDPQPGYTIDLNAGTGKIEVVRNGKNSVDLTFKFEKENRDQGLLYSVSNLRGTTEGFQVLLPRLELVYTAALDSAGNTIKDAKGNTVFQVKVNANGFLGVDNKALFQIADVDFALQYPLPAGESKLGAIKLYGTDGLVFDGDATLNGQAVSAKGKVSDPAGTKLYDLSINSDGKVALTPAQ
jgi:hypothetical protein